MGETLRDNKTGKGNEVAGVGVQFYRIVKNACICEGLER